MSKTQQVAAATSKAETKKAISELSRTHGLTEKKIRSLLDSYTMTEIRNGRMVGREWMPLESVTVLRDVPSN